MFLSSLVFILNIQRTFTGITKPHGTSVYLKAGSPLDLLGQPQSQSALSLVFIISYRKIVKIQIEHTCDVKNIQVV